MIAKWWSITILNIWLSVSRMFSLWNVSLMNCVIISTRRQSFLPPFDTQYVLIFLLILYYFFQRETLSSNKTVCFLAPLPSLPRFFSFFSRSCLIRKLTECFLLLKKLCNNNKNTAKPRTEIKSIREKRNKNLMTSCVWRTEDEFCFVVMDVLTVSSCAHNFESPNVLQRMIGKLSWKVSRDETSTLRVAAAAKNSFRQLIRSVIIIWHFCFSFSLFPSFLLTRFVRRLRE